MVDTKSIFKLSLSFSSNKNISTYLHFLLFHNKNNSEIISIYFFKHLDDSNHIMNLNFFFKNVDKLS